MRLLRGRGRQAALEVDSSRVALWGSSFAGGHVLVKGAELADDWRIRAVVSQARAPPCAARRWAGARCAGQLPGALVGSCMVRVHRARLQRETGESGGTQQHATRSIVSRLCM